ncbi:MAG: CapA family protein [Paludibacter sp.]|jgi:poly-gamma-glutamate synthesis protein (capsule biosynthesis protein)|nr:CapA family protein [Paludibacter sp.]
MKILIAGDYCPIGRNAEIIRNKSYATLFNGFEEITRNVDYSIVNFECPVTTSNHKIKKTGPCIKTEDKSALSALKYAGFSLLTLANNHIQDYGGQGVLDTIKYAGIEGFDVIGAGKNKTVAAFPLIKCIKGINIGFVNIAENEFCAAEDNLAGANTFDFIDNTKTIKELRDKVDKIILIYHGGREHYQLPTPELRRRLRYFIDCGVDAVIGHHTHCFSGYEYYNNKPIVYSVGNFIFDYKPKYQTGLFTEGMGVILQLEENKFKIELIPFFQGRKQDSTLRLLNVNERKTFIERVEELSCIIQDDKLFEKNWQSFLETQNEYYLPSFYIRNIYLRALFMKGFLPASIFKQKHNKLLLNLIRCESHLEISKELLNKK